MFALHALTLNISPSVIKHNVFPPTVLYSNLGNAYIHLLFLDTIHYSDVVQALIKETSKLHVTGRCEGNIRGFTVYAFACVVCEMQSVLFRPQRVNFHNSSH